MFSPEIFVTVFGVIFIAELPDKTAVATLVLATRHRALPVFAGTALALIIQSLIAVAAGGALALLPPRPVHIAAGVLFLASAVSMWRSKDEALAELEAGAGEPVDAGASGEPAEPSFRSAFFKAFAIVFLAELGDLTQLGTAALAARFRSPLTVFAGSALALCSVSALAVFLGNRLSRLINPAHVRRVAAVVFALLGLGFVTGLI